MAISANSTPIWKGVQKTLLSSAGSIQYTIKTETPDRVIFSGKATNRPGESSVVVQLFDVLAPHLTQESIAEGLFYVLDTDAAWLAASEWARRFILSKAGSSTTENIDVRACYAYDWIDFDNSYDNDPVRLSFPSGRPFPVTRRYCPVGTIYLQKKNGSSWTDVVNRYNPTAGPINVVFPTYENLPVGTKFRVVFPDGFTLGTYSIDNSGCASNYTLYYVNRLGGWDSLSLRGICRQTDGYQREESDKFRDAFANTLPDRRVIRTDQATSWELNTGLLTDQEAERFAKNVPNSPLAVLLWGSNVYPVIITDTTARHLNVENNGRVPVNYTLNVKLAQDRVRL